MINMIKRQTKGVSWIGVVLLLIFSLSTGLALLSISMNTLIAAKHEQSVISAQAIADAGIEKAIWMLNQAPTGTYTGTGATNINMGTGELKIVVTGTGNERTITSTGYIPNEAHKKVARSLKAKVGATPNEQGIAFGYAVQVGLGGLNMNNDTVIYGNAYSNGSMTGQGTTKSRITGSASANGTISKIQVDGTTKTGQPQIPMPPYDEEYWKGQANRNNDPATSCVPVGGHIGPKRINGDCTLNNVTIDGPIYITGNLILTGNIYLNNSFGSYGTVVLVEGAIGDSAIIYGTNATPQKGQILFISKGTIDINTWSEGGEFYAPTGTIRIWPHTNPVSIVANLLDMQPNAEIALNTGLPSQDYGNGLGSGAAWGLKEWKIIQAS